MSDTYQCKCTYCHKVMNNHEFNVHKCPNLVLPIPGESWEDYKKRSSKEKRS